MGMSVFVNVRFEGFHSWPDAPAEVAFLRSPHRHEFHVTAVRAVTHDDRDVEIIMLKRAVQLYCDTNFKGPHHMSCEMMARQLAETFSLERCAVSEDGENGAWYQA